MFSYNVAPCRILMIDDDVDQINLLHQALKQIGQVFFESNSIDAVERALSVVPDVILLDIEMPEMNGFEVFDKIKLEPSLSNASIIFITSHNSVEEQLKCLERGAADFISKPLQPSVLAARVKSQIGIKQKEKELIALNRHARVTLDSIGDAVITTDNKGVVTYLNQAAELLIGINASNAINQPIEAIMPLKIGEQGPSHPNPIKLAIQDRRVVGMAINCKMQRQDGSWIDIEDSASPLVSDENEVVGGVLIFKDINQSRAMALKMSHVLQHDQLTSLPNRFLFVERLDDELKVAAKSNKKLGLILLDIDRFRLFNEEFGFDYGDALLRKIANRIQSELIDEQIVSRHNADEFMILVPNLKDPSELINFALLIKQTILELTVKHPEIHSFTLSIGLSLYPDDALTSESLMFHADNALHRAKLEPQHDGVCFYSEDLETRLVARRQNISQLKNVITYNKVTAYYQPLIEPKTGKTIAVEALMRIIDEDNNVLLPRDFIEMAEETRLIIPLGEQLIRQALAQLKNWNKNSITLRLCLNVSPIQFVDPSFLPFLLNALEEYEVNPATIELEVTESLMLQNMQHVIQDMVQLRKLGVSISVDDFGTGYSCLSYLRDLPIDVLKIDRSFVAQINESSPKDALVCTITNLANEMGLQSVAEGVETQFHAQRLRELGVTLLQGYYFSKPVPAQDIKAEYPL
ncbi:two-component system response regulator [Shewanella algae]|uniref:two-component system response regulator n=1 Tax=Shewanella algae TaxID=38313 RepID=UPI0031F4FAC2